MRYKADEVDTWTNTCPKEGDCEDFALCKARVLLNMGFDKSDLKIMVGQIDFKNEKTIHAVLVVDDTYVLDNNNKTPIKYDKYASSFNHYYTCYLKDGSYEIFDSKLLNILTKYPEFEHKIKNMCENVIINKRVLYGDV